VPRASIFSKGRPVSRARSRAALCESALRTYMWVTGLGLLVLIAAATSLRSLFNW
jgi:hypothetical protein